MAKESVKQEEVPAEVTAPAETVAAPVAAPAPPTEESLMAELDKAMKSRDFKAVATVSRKIDALVKEKEKAELAEKQAVSDAIAALVRDEIHPVIEDLVANGQLDKADGVWYSWDFGEKDPVVRVLRTAPKAARAGSGGGGGGGGGKVFDVSTTDLLNKYGHQVWKDGLTYLQVHESSTDKNSRFQVRRALLKLEGLL